MSKGMTLTYFNGVSPKFEQNESYIMYCNVNLSMDYYIMAFIMNLGYNGIK